MTCGAVYEEGRDTMLTIVATGQEVNETYTATYVPSYGRVVAINDEHNWAEDADVLAQPYRYALYVAGRFSWVNPAADARYDACGPARGDLNCMAQLVIALDASGQDFGPSF